MFWWGFCLPVIGDKERLEGQVERDGEEKLKCMWFCRISGYQSFLRAPMTFPKKCNL
jgi:hypothetical protein